MLDNIPDLPPYYECDSIKYCLQDEGIKESDIIVFNWKKFRLHFNSKNRLTLNSRTQKITLSVTSNAEQILDYEYWINNKIKLVIQKVQNVMSYNLRYSKRLLEEIRQDSKKWNVEFKINMLRTKLEIAWKSLNDIWTNEDELKKLKIEWAKIAAKDILKEIKEKHVNGNIDYLLRHFANCLKITWEHLDQYWISQEDLDYFDRKWHEISAREAINSLKTAKNDDYKYFLKVFVFNAQESWKDFEAFWISNQEIYQTANK